MASNTTGIAAAIEVSPESEGGLVRNRSTAPVHNPQRKSEKTGFFQSSARTLSTWCGVRARSETSCCSVMMSASPRTGICVKAESPVGGESRIVSPLTHPHDQLSGRMALYMLRSPGSTTAELNSTPLVKSSLT